MGGFKNPFVKSLLNLNVDYSDRFFFNLKRYRASRLFLVNLNILNKVWPRTLADFMLHRRRLPYSRVGRFRIVRQASRLFFGAKLGGTKAFLKRTHSESLRVHRFREDFLIRSFVCKLDFFLYSLKFFASVLEAKNYINEFGIFVSDTLIFSNRYVLKQLQVVSFRSEHRLFFKARFYYYFSTSLVFGSFFKRLYKIFLNTLSNKQNIFNYSLLQKNITFSHSPLARLNSVSSFFVPLFRSSGTFADNLIGFALWFKRFKWLKRWRSAGARHPENIKRWFGHKYSLSPFRFNELVRSFAKRTSCFLTRALFYKKIRRNRIFPKSLSKLKTKGKQSNFKFRKRKRGRFGFRNRFLWFGRRGKQQKKTYFVKFYFFQEFTKSLLRLLFWRLRKARLFAVINRLAVRFFKTLTITNSSIFYKRLCSISTIVDRVSLSFKVGLGVGFRSLLSASSFCSVVLLCLTKHVALPRAVSPRGAARVWGFGSQHYRRNYTYRLVKRGWKWRTRFRRFVLKQPNYKKPLFIFCKDYFKYYPSVVLNSLKFYTPWYRYRPFRHSKLITRFYRLHPRFSGIFFLNFLPRFVEPSFKKFEFLIRPGFLSSIDLRLPFKVKKSTKLNFISSLV